MKRFPALLLLIVLLSGCSPHTALTDSQAQMEFAGGSAAWGLYDPDSALEASTGGAIRCYPLGGRSHSGIRPLSDGLLLFSHTASTTVLTKLEGIDAIPTASLELPFCLESTDPSLRRLETGFSFYDPVTEHTVRMDSQLQPLAEIPAPRGLSGTPLLSGDGATLYYCTADAIRALDIASGISRVLKECAYPNQTVTGLLLEDTVVQCTLQDGTDAITLFLSSENGATLQTSETLRQIVTAGTAYYASVYDGGFTSWVFGSETSDARMLLISGKEAECFFLPETDSAAAWKLLDSGATQLSHYELTSGRRTASVALEAGCRPFSFASGTDGGIWFLGYDPGYGCDTLYRWDPNASKVTDAAAYTAPYYARESPDGQGLAECAQRARELGARYGVEILVHTQAAAVQPTDCKLTAEYLVSEIMAELNTLDKALGNYPAGFLQTLSGRFDGLTICILRSISESADPDSATGVQFWDGHHAYIALAAGSTSEQVLYRELCHLIDTIVLNESSAYDTWSQLNPSGFSYDYDYAANQTRNSTAYLLEANRYFVDMYSMSFPKEDRARIMEYAMTGGNQALFQSAPMQEKLRTLCIGIREAFGLESSGETFLWEQYLKEPLAAR